MPRRYLVTLIGLAASVIVTGMAVAFINTGIRTRAVAWMLVAGGLGVLASACTDLKRTLWPMEVKDVDDRGRTVVLRPVEELPCEWRPSREEHRFLSRWRGRKPPKSLLWVFLVTTGACAIVAVTLACFDVPEVWVLMLFPLGATGGVIGQRIFMRWHCRAILELWRCASCGYDLTGLPIADDGCHVCPECGAAWKLRGDQPTLSAHGEDAGDDER